MTVNPILLNDINLNGRQPCPLNDNQSCSLTNNIIEVSKDNFFVSFSYCAICWRWSLHSPIFSYMSCS